jgi:hypothetical protein
MSQMDSTPPPEHRKEIRRPGPHGADARDAGDEDAVERAYRRAEGGFEEVKPASVRAAEAVTSLDGEGDEEGKAKGACFIATAAYGDAAAPEVEAFRRFRDRRLLTNRPGTALVHAYYRLSPPLARLIEGKPRLRSLVRKTLDFLARRAASL